MTLLAALVFALSPQAEPAPIPKVEAAARTAIRPSPVWDRLAECESDGDWQANTGNGFYGGTQFLRSTWLWMGGADYAPYPHQASRLEQIKVAERLVAYERSQGRGGYGPWPACARRLGLPK